MAENIKFNNKVDQEVQSKYAKARAAKGRV